MKHCVLMTVYKDSDLINRIISSLPEDWGVFVHIDEKSNIENIKNAVVIKKHKIYWGSFEHVEAFLDLMKIAFEDPRNFEYFHLITGQDYPCFSKTLLNKIETEHKIYMECFLIPQKSWTLWEGGYALYKYQTVSKWCDVRKGFGKICNIIAKIIQYKKKKYLPPYEIYGGSLYSTFPRYAIEYVLDSHLLQDLRMRLKWSLCGEETFFQTLLMNSPYSKDIISSNFRYMDWSDAHPPKILTLQDYTAVREGYLFLRKIKSPESNGLLEKIDAEILGVRKCRLETCKS